MEVHHKIKMAEEVPEAKKRQHNNYTCPECNSTFDSKYNLGKHLKDQHQGKTLSPERKIAKMNHDKVKVKDDKETEQKKELENLQDLLVQTGKEKDNLSIRLSACNLKVHDEVKANEALLQENNHLKVENEKALKNLNDLDKEYTTQIKNLKRTDAQKDHETIYLKAENEKCNRDIENLESVYKEQVIELKKVIAQKDIDLKILTDQRRREGTAGGAQEAEVAYTNKCRECNFMGRNQKELKEHHDKDCPEALIQRIIEEENGVVCHICGMVRDTQTKMQMHMDYHYNDEQDTDWSNSEEVAQFEEEQNVNEVPQDEHDVSGK